METSIVGQNTDSNLHTTPGKMMERKHEWAVILAGGDGTRLKSLTRRITDDERPKQFCPVMGDLTLVEETQRRVALELAKERTLFVVNRLHEPYYAGILGDTPASYLIEQPRNIGTAPVLVSFGLGCVVLFCGDKIVRPMVAGEGTHLRFVWFLMACLGGFEVLGLVGLVIGPVVLTLARELWKQRVRDLALPKVADSASPADDGA